MHLLLLFHFVFRLRPLLPYPSLNLVSFILFSFFSTTSIHPVESERPPCAAALPAAPAALTGALPGPPLPVSAERRTEV